MLSSLQALFLRYAAVHEDYLRGAILGSATRQIGQVEKVLRDGNQVTITGWADADIVRICWPGGAREVTPNIYRGDVAGVKNIRPDVGFEGAVPATAKPLTLKIYRSDHMVFSTQLSHPDAPAPAFARRRLRRAFLRALGRATPELIRYLWAPTPLAKTAVKRALGLEVLARGRLIDGTWFTPPQVCAPSSQTITIVLPIYNALPYLKRCLQRVEEGTDLPWHLIAIDDASTDPELPRWLTAWAKARPGQVTHLPQAQNQGFIGAVNIGLAAAEARGTQGPVVLLNTDAMVPDGWASRLIAPLDDPGVASVTPLSNAAEVLSVPTMGPGITLEDGDVDAIDATAATLGGTSCPDVPTGVGFCMAMARHWLAQVPRLDPAFGRGYGEEVDWSQKTKALGARHLCQPRLFVEHVGGQSFGSEEKLRQLTESNALISKRYPIFDANVQRFITEDPLATPRLALGIVLAARRHDRLPVYLAHTMGGGAEVALQQEVAAHGAAVILRVGGARRWQVDVHVDGKAMVGQTDDLSVLIQLLAPVPRLEIIYSCGVGEPDPITLPSSLLALQRDGRDDTIALRLHDYYPVTPSYTLLENGEFLGTPHRDNKDRTHSVTRPDGTLVTLAQWRDAWGALVDAAREVTAFSPTSAALFLEAYPGAPVKIMPHALPTSVRAVRPQPDGCIAVLGNINHQKGAWVLREIALMCPAQSFVVVGNADSAIPLPRNVTVHGTYQQAEIADLAERYRVSGWLVPAIWPETFSFTTHEALSTGLPVAGFAIGAQGEVLSRAANGVTVPLAPKDTCAARLIQALHYQIAPKLAAE